MDQPFQPTEKPRSLCCGASKNLSLFIFSNRHSELYRSAAHHECTCVLCGPKLLQKPDSRHDALLVSLSAHHTEQVGSQVAYILVRNIPSFAFSTNFSWLLPISSNVLFSAFFDSRWSGCLYFISTTAKIFFNRLHARIETASARVYDITAWSRVLVGQFIFQDTFVLIIFSFFCVICTHSIPLSWLPQVLPGKIDSMQNFSQK